MSVFLRWMDTLERFKRLLVNHLSSSLPSANHLCFCCDVVTRRDSWSVLLDPPKTLITNMHTVFHTQTHTHTDTRAHTHTHTHTHTNTHTPVAAPLGWVSSLAQILCCETLVISFLLSLVFAHICQLAPQPTGATCLTWCNIHPLVCFSK